MSFNAFLLVATTLIPCASGVSLAEAAKAVREAKTKFPSGKSHFERVGSMVYNRTRSKGRCRRVTEY